MVYDEVTRAYLKTILANKTVYYYSDAPYRWAFGGKDGLSGDDDHLLLKMMDKTVLMMNNMTTFDIAVQRDIDTIKNIAMLNVPINYVGEVDSFCREKDIYHYGDRPNPNWDFDVRLDFVLAKKGLFSPLSFAVATKLFPIADVLVSRTDLDINGNHNEKCPH
ncbi:MAG: hypothetical protein PHS98_02960, partial [Bacilli bacterium]|nr:hypothetical protein [Bacilli bacterium]